ncbi:hypothetical protein FLK61_39445 [Paenalkalicoccus suaedae]|uniref:Uncharacterized protein n=1 Tax=Paenalkalicoccus suaedae TaxID=2592382 RepID=A0A859FHX4_9BACI|nr:hypothetical protein FLK61_39445 [Paenalkalicoccus suaedae]
MTKHGLERYRDAMHLLIDQMDDEQCGSKKLWAAAIAYAIGEETGWYTTSKEHVRPRNVHSHFKVSASRCNRVCTTCVGSILLECLS